MFSVRQEPCGMGAGGTPSLSELMTPSPHPQQDSLSLLSAACCERPAAPVPCPGLVFRGRRGECSRRGLWPHRTATWSEGLGSRGRFCMEWGPALWFSCSFQRGDLEGPSQLLWATRHRPGQGVWNERISLRPLLNGEHCGEEHTQPAGSSRPGLPTPPGRVPACPACMDLCHQSCSAGRAWAT